MTEVESRIDAVTVYTDRAQVTRRGEADVPAGSHELVLAHLPGGLVAESVRASARATARARLVATDVRRTFHPDPVEERVAALLREIEDLEDRDRELAQSEDAAAVRRGFLTTLATSAGQQLGRGIARGKAKVDVGADVSAFLSSELAKVDAEARVVGERRRELGKELAAKRRELDLLHARRGPAERTQVAVLLDLEAEGKVELEVRYQVTGASWAPVYDLRLSEGDAHLEDAHLEVVYQAQVTQRSGEDWESVALALSTAKPALGATAPELDPWYLEVWAPLPVTAARGGGAGPRAQTQMAEMPVPAPAPMAAPAAALEMPVAEAEVVIAAVEERGAAVTFSVGGRADIPGDGSPHKVTLGDFSMACELDYVTAPKLVEQAYRRATVTNTSDAILLPGRAQIFVGDEFVGTTDLETVAPDQEVEVYLGVDDRIAVERELVTGSVDKKFLQDKAVLNYAYSIQVTNLRSNAEKVEVLDQVPVSRHESVKVRRGDTSPKASEESEMGEISWQLRLGAGEKQEIRFAFTVEHPRGTHVAGLPPLRD